VAAAPKASRHRHRVRCNQPRPRRRHCVADRPKEQVQRPLPTRREALAFQRLSVTSRVATLQVAPPSHRHLVAHSHRAPGKIRTCDTRFRRLTQVAFGGAASGISAGHTLSVVVEAARCLAPRCATGVPRSSGLGSEPVHTPDLFIGNACRGCKPHSLSVHIVASDDGSEPPKQPRGAPGGHGVRPYAKVIGFSELSAEVYSPTR